MDSTNVPDPPPRRNQRAETQPAARCDCTPEFRRLLQRLQRIEQTASRNVQSLERIERLVNEFADSYLNARFPYGVATDRWAPRSRRFS